MIEWNFVNYIIKKAIKGILHVFWIFPVEKGKITLMNELSYTYGDNLKYIDKYVHEKRTGKYKIVFPLKEGKVCPQNSDIIVTPHSFKYFREVLTSEVIVTNAGGVSFLPKRKNQKIINTWHGGGPYKKTSTDVYNNYWYRKEAQMNSSNTDYILSSCENFTKVEAKSMGFDEKVCIPIGLPRNDILFREHLDIARKVRDYYSIPKDKKFILYAPTFRSNGNQSTSKMISNYIDIDINLLLSSLEKRFQCKWVCGIRLHPKISDIDIRKLNVVNCTLYPDMQELLCCADAVITDYSSLMWDFSFTYRPIFLYAPDIEVYEKERGFYMPISEWPYSIAHNNDEMKKIILEFDEEQYIKKVKKHHIVSGSYETGNACAKIVELIDKIHDINNCA